MSVERIHSIKYGIEIPEKRRPQDYKARPSKCGIILSGSDDGLQTKTISDDRHSPHPCLLETCIENGKINLESTTLQAVWQQASRIATHPNLGGLTKDTVEDATGCIP
ncbi:hypothetical protein V8E54_002040 [Elaphomyces granulatus]